MKKSIIISADEIKKTLKGYNPTNSEQFHKQSAKMADKQFLKVIKESTYNTVILMSGGAASGKTEYLSEYLMNDGVIIMDGTLLNLSGAEIKIKNSIKNGMKVEIHAVIPKSLKTAFLVFLNRERKFSPLHFYNTHSLARKTLAEIANKYPEIPITLIESEYIELKESGTMKFSQKEFQNRAQLIEYLSTIQYNNDHIKDIVLHD